VNLGRFQGIAALEANPLWFTLATIDAIIVTSDTQFSSENTRTAKQTRGDVRSAACYDFTDHLAGAK
jgi:hypothetical protein